MGVSLAALMTARPNGCVETVGLRGRLQSSRRSVLFPRWSGRGFDCSCCFGVGVGGVGWHARSKRGSWGLCREDLGMRSVEGMDSPWSSMVDCSVGGREDSAVVKQERWRSRRGSIGRYA